MKQVKLRTARRRRRSEVRCAEEPQIDSMEELQKKLGSSPDAESAEAQKRLAQYGPNEIAEKKDNPFLKFLTYFGGPSRG